MIIIGFILGAVLGWIIADHIRKRPKFKEQTVTHIVLEGRSIKLAHPMTFTEEKQDEKLRRKP